MKLNRILAAVPLVALMASGALAQDYPNRPIRLVHGFAAGGNADTISRIIGDEMARGLGQPVVVEARPGAGGNIASDYVARSPADGYTLQLLIGGHSVSPAIYTSLPFDPVDDYEFITTVSEFPFLIATRAGEYASLQALIDHAGEEPDNIKFGSAGIGTTQHLTGELLAIETGVSFLHIPYQGGAAAIAALLGGEVDLVIDAGTVISGHASGGALDVLGVSSPERWSDTPDVPTVSETVSPGFDVMSWSGLGAPAGTPPEVIERLRAEAHRALGEEAVQQRLRLLGSEAAPSSGEETRAMIERQIAEWTRVVETAGIERR